MHIHKLNEVSAEDIVSLASEALLQGNVVLLPTETVYGLMCIYGNEMAKEKIITIKNRPKERQFQLLIDSIEDVAFMGVKLNAMATILGKKFWPGGLTLVVEKGDESVGLRMPDHQLVRSIIRKCKSPLVATSANISGEPPLVQLENVGEYFCYGQPDLVVEAKVNSDGASSTVVEVRGEKVNILREGVISKEEIYKALALV